MIERPRLPALWLAALLALALPLALPADDTLLAVQKKLSQLGFYKGVADGQPGSQTGAAIRRYQIAENLKVTGSLNRQTLEQLGIKGSASLSPYVPIADLFKGGPLASASSDAQVSIVRKAQKNLGLLGYYNGPENAMPGGALVAAIKIWQKSGGLRPSGRFDAATLKGLDLVPD